MKYTLSLLTLFCSVFTASAQSYNLNLGSIDRGWVKSTGQGNASNVNYITGNVSNSEYRSYFVFDLSAIDGEVTAASIMLTNPASVGFSSANANETFILRAVSSSIPLTGSAFTNLAIFNDLGDGDIFGSAVMDVTSNIMNINLNSDFLNAINTSGLQFVVGGSISTLDGDLATNEYVFGSTYYPLEADPNPVQLNLTILPGGGTVPETSTGLLGVIAGLSLLRRRR